MLSITTVTAEFKYWLCIDLLGLFSLMKAQVDVYESDSVCASYRSLINPYANNKSEKKWHKVKL